MNLETIPTPTSTYVCSSKLIFVKQCKNVEKLVVEMTWAMNRWSKVCCQMINFSAWKNKGQQK